MTARSHYHGLLTRVVQQTEQLEGEALEAVLGCFEVRRYAAGEFFVMSGERSTELGFVGHGLLRGYYALPDGAEIDRRFYSEGSFVMALTAVLRDGENHMQVQACEDTQMLVAEYSRITAAMVRHHSLERLGRRLMEQAWVDRVRRESELLCVDSRRRYRAFLQRHAKVADRLEPRFIASYLNFTEEELEALRSQEEPDVG